jgi:hypothetical protein
MGHSRVPKVFFRFGIIQIWDRLRWRPISPVYHLAMKNNTAEAMEHLLRVRTTRRGKPVELCVHYERAASSGEGCVTYRLFSVEDDSFSTGGN